MKAIITIDGMSCSHCAARVEEALDRLDGVKSKVNLKNKTAEIKSKNEISDEILAETINKLGFTFVSATRK